MASRIKLFLPLILFALLALLLFAGLGIDPQRLPSTMIDQPLPRFSLPALEGGGKLTREDLLGEVALLNVWATWCAACRVEHPYLQELADRGVPIYGLNYKDEDAAARQWLARLGDPYRRNIVDREGSLALDLGVYGAPETYLFDADGTIQYRHVGVVNEQVWRDILGPRYRSLTDNGDAGP